MRSLAVAILVCSACALSAQEQEPQLMTRLLKPDMALADKTQNKKFVAADHASVDRQATVSTFYLQKRHEALAYSNAREFDTRGFYGGRDHQTVTTSSSLLAARSSSPMRTYDTPTARTSVELRDNHAHTTVASSNYAGNRTFLDKGKSQKSLDRKNKPMTIDDIRELLNKSK